MNKKLNKNLDLNNKENKTGFIFHFVCSNKKYSFILENWKALLLH